MLSKMHMKKQRIRQNKAEMLYFFCDLVYDRCHDRGATKWKKLTLVVKEILL